MWSGMTTKSCNFNFPATTFERSTSIKRPAFRSDCKMRLAMLVLVVAKNTLVLLSIASGLAFLAGIAMEGLHALYRKLTGFSPCCSLSLLDQTLFVLKLP